MKIALIYYDTFKNKGGVLHVIENILKSFNNQKRQIYIFNEEDKTKHTLELLTLANIKGD